MLDLAEPLRHDDFRLLQEDCAAPGRRRSVSLERVRCIVLVSFALLASLALPGCSEPCHDADGDGRGEGCAAGPDCDDGNRKLGARCDDLARMCALDRSAEGCPCLGG